MFRLLKGHTPAPALPFGQVWFRKLGTPCWAGTIREHGDKSCKTEEARRDAECHTKPFVVVSCIASPPIRAAPLRLYRAMQPYTKHRQRPDRRHNEQRSHGQSSRRDRSGKDHSHRARHPHRHHSLEGDLETCQAPPGTDEVQGEDYVQSWLRKTQEQQTRRRHSEHDEQPHQEVLRAPLEALGGKLKKRTRPGLNPAGSASGHSRHSDEHRFEKRARHKTLGNKYDYRRDRERVTEDSRNNRAARRTEAAGNPEPLVNRASKTKGGDGGRRAHGNQGELDELSDFFHDVHGRKSSPHRRHHRHLQGSATSDGAPSNENPYSAAKKARDGRRSPARLPRSTQSLASVHQQQKGYKSGSYFSWSTSHHSEANDDEGNDPSSREMNVPSRNSAKTERSGLTLGRHSRARKQPTQTSRPAKGGHSYKDAKVQTELNIYDTRVSRRYSGSARYEHRGVMAQEEANSHDLGQWVFVGRTQPPVRERLDTAYYHTEGNTSAVGPSAVDQSRGYPLLSYIGPPPPVCWKHADQPPARYSVRHDHPGADGSTLRQRAAAIPGILVDEDTPPETRVGMTHSYVVHQPRHTEEEAYLGRFERNQDLGSSQLVLRQPFRVPTPHEPVHGIEESLSIRAGTSRDMTPVERRPYIEAMEDYINRIEREADLAREYGGDLDDACGRPIEGDPGENIGDIDIVHSTRCGAPEPDPSLQYADARATLGDILWFDK